jgi:hypothetical protein
MANVVGTLTVDLVANTASFSGDLGKAAQSADSFGKSAENAGGRMDFSMREAKGSMMLLGEELGVHIPRHLQALIAEIPGIGAAFAEMLPIVGVVAAIAIIEKLITKAAEAKEKLTAGWNEFGTATQDVFNGLEDRLLRAGIKTDELAGRHLEALHKELELIDHQSLKDLSAEFGKLAKAADAMLEKQKSSWYEIVSGSQGAQNALTQFRAEYDLILASRSPDAADKAFQLLVGTLGAANKELAAMQDAQAKTGIHNDKLLRSQQLLVGILEDQVKATREIAELNAADKGNVTNGDAQQRAANAFKESSRIMHEAMQAMKDEAIAAAKADEDWMKVRIQMAKEGEKGINALIASKQKEAEEWVKLTEKMASEDIRHAQVMADLAAKDGGQSKNGENKRFQAQMAAYEKERQLLTSTGEQRVADEAKIDHKVEEEAAKHQNKMDELTRKGEQQRADIAKHFAQMTIFENKSMAAALEQTGKQMLSELINNTLQGLMVQEDAAAKEKLLDAEGSATAAFKAAMKGLPFPINAMVAPAAAAVAFAGVMAFEHGGEIPGSGAIPIIGHGGETVVTKALTDQVRNSTGGKGGGGHTVNLTTHIHTVDAENFGKLLDKHANTVAAHVRGQLRRMNKG